MKLVYLKWQDCAFVSSNWKPAEKLPESAAFQLLSAGILVKETPEGLYIATDYALADNQYRYTCFVPHVLIKERREFDI